MKESVQRIVEKEGESGLIIKKAFYGKIDENSMYVSFICFGSCLTFVLNNVFQRIKFAKRGKSN